MYNLWRALKVTFKYKMTILWSVICALCLAICWGGNITAVYPLVQISFQGENAQQWLHKNIEEKEAALVRLQEKQKILQDTSITHQDTNNQEKQLKSNFRAQEGLREELVWYAHARPYIEKYAPTDTFMTIVWLMVFVVIGTLIKSVFAFLHGILSARLGNLGTMEIREICFERLLHYEIDHFSQRGVSDAMSRFTGDVGNLSGGLSLIYGKLVREPLKMIACVIGALWISWQLFLFTCLFVPLAFCLLQWMAKSLKRVARNSMAEMANLYDRIGETFRAIRVVKAFNREDYEQEKFHQTNWNCYSRGMKIAKYGSLVNPFIETMATGMMIIAVLVGAWLVSNETTSFCGITMSKKPLDLGSLVLFYGFLLGAADPVRRLSDFFLSLQTAVAAADRVYEIIDRKVPLMDPVNPKSLGTFSDKISFQNVCFSYTSLKEDTPNLRYVLRNINLEIPYGKTVVIVGPSGCGKSSLLNLIPRFYDPTSGVVEMDSIPLQELTMREIRHQLAIVAQESILFNDTIFENIRYGVPDATPDDVIAAAKMAHAHRFIMEDLAQGYETTVGPGGGLLSGGQRQRIALARALLCDPPILLLDEATSQIDMQSEQFIHDALSELTHTRTIVIVTHRLSAIRLADEVVVMNEGQIEAKGTHEDLLHQSSYYAELWKQESVPYNVNKATSPFSPFS